MPKSYSIAEAQKRLHELVRSVEQDSAIQLTRRGIPVAVLLSIQEYERLQRPQESFWERTWPFDLPRMRTGLNSKTNISDYTNAMTA
ncbi:MAG: type II toxin-antitoxin system prevent-host-death family antitoxin [Caldilineaceae bacterium]|nr:type II toxin-antitoxin system prevent-host-death family antitoxin [Caldilineaceae bacterium]